MPDTPERPPITAGFVYVGYQPLTQGMYYVRRDGGIERYEYAGETPRSYHVVRPVLAVTASLVTSRQAFDGNPPSMRPGLRVRFGGSALLSGTPEEMKAIIVALLQALRANADLTEEQLTNIRTNNERIMLCSGE